MLLRTAFCLCLIPWAVLADPPAQPLQSATEVAVEMRAIERRVASDLSKNGDYAALKARQAELSTQLANCDDKDRPALAAQKRAVTEQIETMESAELAKDGQYAALCEEYDRLAMEAVSVSDGRQETHRSGYRASDRYRYARLKIGARKSSLIGVQTFTFQQ